MKFIQFNYNQIKSIKHVLSIEYLLLGFLYFLFFPIPIWIEVPSAKNPFDYFIYTVLVIGLGLQLLRNRKYIIFIDIFIFIVISIYFYFELHFNTKINYSLLFYFLENLDFLLQDSIDFIQIIPLGVYIQYLSFIILLLLIVKKKINFPTMVQQNRNRIFFICTIVFVSISILHSQSIQSNFHTNKESQIYPNNNIIPKQNLNQNQFLKSSGMLTNDTDVFIFLLEGINYKYWNEIAPQKFKFTDSFLSIDHCYISVPHSSKSIFTLLTGEIQIEKSRSVLTNHNKTNNFPKFFETLGYDTSFIFSQNFYLEGIDTYAHQLFMLSIDSDGLDHWAKKNNLSTEKFPWGINDEILINYLTSEILDSKKPIFSLIGFSNTHSPYFISKQNPDYKKENLNSLERYKSSIHQTVHILNQMIHNILSARKKEPLIIILSDHGESFGENNFWKHNYSILNQETRIPCLVNHPEILGNFKISEASLADFYLSIISLFQNSKSEQSLQSLDSLESKTIFDPSRNIFSNHYRFEIPLKTWNVDTSLGFVQNDKKYIFNKETRILYIMNLDETKITETNSEKDINLFYHQWNKLRER